MRSFLALLALSALAACGPIQSTAALIDADVEVEAARAAGAARTSPYEFTGAEAHLQKARELSGAARYETAAKLASRATDLAKAARLNAVAASNRPQESR